MLLEGEIGVEVGGSELGGIEPVSLFMYRYRFLSSKHDPSSGGIEPEISVS